MGSSRGAVHRTAGQRQAEDVGLHARAAAAVGREHAVAEVEGDGPDAALGEIDAQVARAGGEVDDRGARGKGQEAHGLAAPAHVQPKRHDAVHEVVARGDGVEHLADRLHLVVALGQLLGVPAALFDHCLEGYCRTPGDLRLQIGARRCVSIPP